MHDLAIVFLWIFHAVHKPEGIVCIGNLDHICIDVKRKFFLPVVNRPIGTLIDNLCRTIDCLDIATKLGLGCLVRTTVKNNHLRLEKLFHHHGSHICQIHLKCGGIHCGQRLYNYPVLRQCHLVDIPHTPRTIVFQEHRLRSIFITQLLQLLRRKILFLVNRSNGSTDGL